MSCTLCKTPDVTQAEYGTNLPFCNQSCQQLYHIGDGFDVLPNEDIVDILMNTEFKSLRAVCQTNIRFYNICNDEYFRKLYSRKHVDEILQACREMGQQSNTYIEQWLTSVLIYVPDTTGDVYRNTFLYAVIKQSIGIIKIFLKYGQIDPNLLIPESSGLLIAAATGNVEIVRLFLKDPRIDPSNIHGNVALAWAIANRNYDIINALLSDGRVQIAQQLLDMARNTDDEYNTNITGMLTEYMRRQRN